MWTKNVGSPRASGFLFLLWVVAVSCATEDSYADPDDMAGAKNGSSGTASGSASCEEECDAEELAAIDAAYDEYESCSPEGAVLDCLDDSAGGECVDQCHQALTNSENDKNDCYAACGD
jgi:hypothetical protein